jgi:dimethylhistidine N-methyltransferase
MSWVARRPAIQGGASFRFLDLKPRREDFRAAVEHGLTQSPKTLPPKFFYDARGSALFDQICETPEYYVTRTELAMLDANAGEIAALAGPAASVIEFGCGSADKIRRLLHGLDAPADYVAIDISRDHLLQSAEDIAIEFGDVNVSAICADFSHGFALPDEFCQGDGRRLGFFPGSTIGNQTPEEAAQFLKLVRGIVGPEGALLIGVDLKKDADVLHAAYNDVAGVTAEFNLNLLHRMKAELGADVDPNAFEHRAFYNEGLGRIEMHLMSREAQNVRLNGHRFAFAKGETIHTECSYKYELDEVADLARSSGFAVRRSWTDPRRLFSVHYLEAREIGPA